MVMGWDDLIIIGNSCSLDDITKYHHHLSTMNFIKLKASHKM